MTHEKMREILRGIDQTEIESEYGWWETSTGAEFGKKKLQELEQALADVKETPKNEHDSGDVLKRAPLVRLTDAVIGELAGKNMKQGLHPTRYYLHAGDFANSIMDAMDKKNRG